MTLFKSASSSTSWGNMLFEIEYSEDEFLVDSLKAAAMYKSLESLSPTHKLFVTYSFIILHIVRRALFAFFLSFFGRREARSGEPNSEAEEMEGSAASNGAGHSELLVS